MKSDGLEQLEDRLTMFQVPHKMPIGGARLAMDHTQFAQHARPVLIESQAHEQKVLDLFVEQARGPVGMRSDHMRGLVQQRGLSHPNEGGGVDQRAQWQQNQPPPPRGQLSFGAHAGGGVAGGAGAGGRAGGPTAGRRAVQPSQQPSFVPSAAMLGADMRGGWAADRDQVHLQYGTDPSVLQEAAESAKENEKIANQNRLRAR